MRADANPTPGVTPAEVIARAGQPIRVGSGYNPTAWCHKCHAPYPAGRKACPECAAKAVSVDGARIIQILTGTLLSARPEHLALILRVSPGKARTLLDELKGADLVRQDAKGRWELTTRGG